MIQKLYTCVLLFLVTIVSYSHSAKDESPKIAVIGGGIGGASSAHYLRKLFGPNVHIDVYEEDTIGGRLATIKLAGSELESGGSIIHDKNMYMVNFTRLLGLQKRDPNPGRLGIFAGSDLVFQGSKWGLVMVSQLAWRYGWDVYRLKKFIDKFVDDFSNIYTVQDSGHTFTTVDRLIASMSPRFVALLERSIADELRNEGFSELFINELVTGGIRGNYGQDVDIQALAGTVSMGGAGTSLWSVEGGNKLVVERLLETSAVNVIHRHVSRITKRPDNRHDLESAINSGEELENTSYDIIVIAVPLYDGIAGLDISGVTSRRFPHRYKRTVATFVQGWPHSRLFGVANVNSIPEIILTGGERPFFSAVGRQTSVHYRKKNEKSGVLPIWKVFSQKLLSAKETDELFVSHLEISVKDWQAAYPHYTPPYTRKSNLPPFELSDNVYFANAMEMAVSTMETSVIAARNVAMLAHQRWIGQTGLVDQQPVAWTTKQEL